MLGSQKFSCLLLSIWPSSTWKDGHNGQPKGSPRTNREKGDITKTQWMHTTIIDSLVLFLSQIRNRNTPLQREADKHKKPHATNVALSCHITHPAFSLGFPFCQFTGTICTCHEDTAATGVTHYLSSLVAYLHRIASVLTGMIRKQGPLT